MNPQPPLPPVSIRAPVTLDAVYKTELCSRWVSGMCPWGDSCRFAHGADELKPRARPARYKTQLCRTFLETNGNCPYGERCNFLHAFSLPTDPPPRPSSAGGSSSSTGVASAAVMGEGASARWAPWG